MSLLLNNPTQERKQSNHSVHGCFVLRFHWITQLLVSNRPFNNEAAAEWNQTPTCIFLFFWKQTHKKVCQRLGTETVLVLEESSNDIRSLKIMKNVNKRSIFKSWCHRENLAIADHRKALILNKNKCISSVSVELKTVYLMKLHRKVTLSEYYNMEKFIPKCEDMSD